MIARLQRALLALWLSALAGAVFAWKIEWFGAPTATALLVVLLTGHALVLAGEFLAMHRSNRRDPGPRATWHQVVAAWWRESVHAPQVFFWRQPLRQHRWPDRLSDLEPNLRNGAVNHRPGVILVHGYLCNRGLWNIWLKRLTAEGTPVIAVDLTPAFGSIDAYVPVIDAAVARITRATGRAPVVVAHSMGGLAVRRWWVDRAPAALQHLITLGSPHHGTRLARLGTTTNARQMRKDSHWLQALHAAERTATRARITCVYSHCDNIVFPASRAVLDGARAVHLPATPHVAMVDHPAAWALLQEQLRTAPAHPGASDPVPCSRTAP